MHAPATPMVGAFPLPRAEAPEAEPARPEIDLSSNDSAASAAVDPAAVDPAAPVSPPSFSADLLAEDPDFSALRELRRFATGLGLSALYGLSLGARQGGKAFFHHAAGVPAALLAVAALGVPALYITLALFDAPIEPPRAIRAAARATAQAGLTLAGLAPAAALFVVSSDLPHTAAIAGAFGLVIGGVFGLRVLFAEVRAALREARVSLKLTAALGCAGFGLFAVALAARIWTSALPLIGGGR
ncbi:MAG: hypothetical protein U0359_08565 [Byssovorax sp.]